VPLTVGGGVRSVADMRAALRAGADKVSVNTAAVRNPDLIDECAAAFGSQCVVLAVDAKQVDKGKWEVYIHGGRTPTGKDAVAWITEAVARGAGEIELLEAARRAVSVPVIASGGAGTIEHCVDALQPGRADAVLAASIFHRKEIEIEDLKEGLAAAGIPARTTR
jgi:cyclase